MSSQLSIQNQFHSSLNLSRTQSFSFAKSAQLTSFLGQFFSNIQNKGVNDSHSFLTDSQISMYLFQYSIQIDREIKFRLTSLSSFLIYLLSYGFSSFFYHFSLRRSSFFLLVFVEIKFIKFLLGDIGVNSISLNFFGSRLSFDSSFSTGVQIVLDSFVY